MRSRLTNAETRIHEIIAGGDDCYEDVEQTVEGA